MRTRAAAGLLVLVVGLSACSGDPEPGPTGASSPPSGTASPSDTATGDADPADPTPAQPTTALLDWEPVEGEAADGLVVVGRGAEVRVPPGAARAVVTAGGREVAVEAGRDRRVTDAFLDATHAVLVAQDRREERAQVVTVVELETGDTATVDDPRTGPGGPFAFADGQLAYATYRPGSDYCLAVYDVARGAGEQRWCSPPRHGFSNLELSPAGLTMMTFDDTRPVACRTAVRLEGDEVEPVAGPEECKAWDVAATATGSVWSQVRNERRVEGGDFRAEHDGTRFDLGPGSTGTLTTCGDSVYFVRDTQREGEPARLLRWTPQASLEIVYESPGEGEAFLAPPLCADGVLTVSAFGEGGDETVSATVPG